MQSFSGRSNVKEGNACPSDVGMNGGRCAEPSVPNIISYIYYNVVLHVSTANCLVSSIFINDLFIMEN